MKTTIIRVWEKVKKWLQSLSFRTGVIVLLCCIPFYILSFAQMLLPISAAAKGVLWTVLFGLAKTCQYGGLTILGFPLSTNSPTQGSPILSALSLVALINRLAIPCLR